MFAATIVKKSIGQIVTSKKSIDQIVAPQILLGDLFE